MEKTAMKVMFMVVNAGFAEAAIELAREAGARGASIINARGCGSIHKSIMGISVDTEKEMVISLMERETAEKVMAAIKEKAGPGSPVNGICFTLPVDKMIGMNGCIPEKQE